MEDQTVQSYTVSRQNQIRFSALLLVSFIVQLGYTFYAIYGALSYANGEGIPEVVYFPVVSSALALFLFTYAVHPHKPNKVTRCFESVLITIVWTTLIALVSYELPVAAAWILPGSSGSEFLLKIQNYGGIVMTALYVSILVELRLAKRWK